MAAIIFAVLNFLVMLALIILLIVLTKKGKFSRGFLDGLKASQHGAWKYRGMRILQIALWVMAAWSFIIMAVCILCAVMKPLDAFIIDTSKIYYIANLLIK